MFTISPPSPSETPSTASIHISSMSSNPLLPLQFPTPASLADLHEHLTSDALGRLEFCPPRILVARVDGAEANPLSEAVGGSGSNVIASFAKWDIVRPRRHQHPRAASVSPPPPTLSEPALGSRRLESGAITDARQKLQVALSHQHYHHAVERGDQEQKHSIEEEEDDNEDEEWPASANREYLTAYSSVTSIARRKAMGSRPFLHLTFLCTDHRFRGHGAGTALMSAVTKVARTEGLPVFLESTIDAMPFYEKLGFVEVGGFRMNIPVDGLLDPEKGVYEEICMVLEQKSI